MEHPPKWGKLCYQFTFARIDSNSKFFFRFSFGVQPRLLLRRRVLYPAELYGRVWYMIIARSKSNCNPLFSFFWGGRCNATLGGECSIQLSYEDMSDFWLEIRIYATFSSFRIGSRLFNYLCFLDELLHPTFLDTFAFGGKLYNTYFDRFELSSSFSYSSKASGKPLP